MKKSEAAFFKEVWRKRGFAKPTEILLSLFVKFPVAASRRLHSPFFNGLLGDRYTEGLRKAYPDVPGTVDYALYWWHRAAQLVREGKTRRFGFITSRTINQPRNRGVFETHMQGDPSLSIVWAIANHPWHDPVSQAQVRIAMTVGCAGDEEGVLVDVGKDGTLTKAATGKINPNLTIGVDVSSGHHPQQV